MCACVLSTVGDQLNKQPSLYQYTLCTLGVQCTLNRTRFFTELSIKLSSVNVGSLKFCCMVFAWFLFYFKH